MGREAKLGEPAPQWLPVASAPISVAAPAPAYGSHLRNVLLGALVFLNMGLPWNVGAAPTPGYSATHETATTSAPDDAAPTSDITSQIRTITANLPTDRPEECRKVVSEQLVPLYRQLSPIPPATWHPRSAVPLGVVATATALAISDAPAPPPAAPTVAPDNPADPVFRTSFPDYVRLYEHFAQNRNLSAEALAHLFAAARDSVWHTPQGTVVAGHPAIQYFFTQLLLGGTYVTWSLDPVRQPDLCLNWGTEPHALPCSPTHGHPAAPLANESPLEWRIVPGDALPMALSPEARAHYLAQAGAWRVNRQDTLYVGQYAGEDTDEQLLLEHKWVRYHLRVIEQFPGDVLLVTRSLQQLFAMDGMDGYIALRLGHRILELLAFQPNIPRELKLYYAFSVMTPLVLTVLDQQEGQDKYRLTTMAMLWSQMLTHTDEATPHVGGFVQATRTADDMRWEDFFTAYQYSGLVGMLVGGAAASRWDQQRDFQERRWREFERTLQQGLCGTADTIPPTPVTLRHHILKQGKMLLLAVGGWLLGSGTEAFLLPRTNSVQEIYFVDLKQSARGKE